MEKTMTNSKHNNPPDPIDEALAPYADAIAESDNWLDGEKVETEEQMKAVDAILRDIRAAGTAVAKAEKSEVAPLYDKYKAEKARWKPTLDDLKARKDGLAALVNEVKRKLAEEKEAAKRAAYEEARRLEREAEEKSAKANAANIEEQRAAMEAKQAAEDAKRAASAANKDTVKGLRTVTKYEITDHRAALHWIAAEDKVAMTEFIEEYVRRNHKTSQIDGVNVWQEKEAY
jgi:YesN/AraC family two-component response regulator